MDNGQGLTWQKVGTVIAIFIVVIPWLTREAYRIVFPLDRLMYDVQEPINAKGFSAFSVVISNAGSRPQDAITITIPSASYNPEEAYIRKTTPAVYGAFGPNNLRPGDLIHAASSGYTVSVGRLLPDESVRVSFVSLSQDDIHTWTVPYNLRVDSRQGGVQKGAGIAIAEDDGSAHGMLWTGAPYLVALAVPFFLILMFSGVIFSIVFDSSEKQMTRLWKQMDLLQEKIDKERRYK